MSQAFTLTNWGSATSLGVHKRGTWFKKGDVPASQSLAVGVAAAQFYGLRYWKDGSLKYARMLLRDATLAAGATRSYAITATTGTMATGSVAAIGNTGLAAALTGHDVKIAFANVQTWDCSSSSGNYAALGSGSYTASLAAHAITSTRWTLLTTGPVADVWQGWGMATDNAGGASDAHLKVNWYITRWKNADGSTLGFQVGAVLALDWWSVANKYFLQYDAALLDGASTIVSYTGVKHQYHSQWLMCVNDGGLNAGTAPWIGATQPTLHCSFDRDYAVAAGAVPPLDTAKRPAPAIQYAYVPCGPVADPNPDHPNSHRVSIDAAGGYQGRGVITRFDADAFMAGTVQAYTVARLNALTGLGVPYHYRSNRTRTRPGETADMANTSIPLLLAPLAASASDFTAQGLPVAVDAYTGNDNDVSHRDGFKWQVGIQDPSNPGRALDSAPSNARGGWLTSLDASHAVSYSYFMALISGDEWLLEAQIDLAMNLAHQTIYSYHQNRAPFASTYNPACPTTGFTGLLGQWQDNNLRYVGWSQLIQGHAFGLLPTDHAFYGYAQALVAHQGDYIQANLDYLPADFAASGTYYPENGYPSVFSPWMAAFGACGAYAHYLLNEDPRWKRLGDHIANWTIAKAAAGKWYDLEWYRSANRYKNAPWDATTNPQIPAAQQGYLQLTPTLVGSTGVFTQQSGNQFDAVGYCPPPLRNGDLLLATATRDGDTLGRLPPGMAEGTVSYVRDLVPGDQLSSNRVNSIANPPSWRIAATPGGAALTFSSDVTATQIPPGNDPPVGVNFAITPQASADYPVCSATGNGKFPFIPGWDNYVPPNISVIMMARQAGNTACTTAIRDGAIAFTAPMDSNSYYYSAFDMATTA